MPTRKGDQTREPARLQRPRAEVRAAVEARITSGQGLLQMPVRYKAELEELRSLSYTWSDGNKALLQQVFTTTTVADDYAGELLFGVVGGTFDLGQEEAAAKSWIKSKVRRLAGIVEQIQFMDESPAAAGPRSAPEPSDPIGTLERLRRFNRFARELRRRHGGRTPLSVDDEYDVQDLVRAILALDFDDVRPEEWTPSYAGGASRVDFLLKAEQVVVEIKMTRDGLTDRRLGEELVIDIARYRSHPDCKTLICVIYDPDHHVNNPSGLIADLERLGDPPRVKVFVTPS